MYTLYSGSDSTISATVHVQSNVYQLPCWLHRNSTAEYFVDWAPTNTSSQSLTAHTSNSNIHLFISRPMTWMSVVPSGHCRSHRTSGEEWQSWRNSDRTLPTATWESRQQASSPRISWAHMRSWHATSIKRTGNLHIKCPPTSLIYTIKYSCLLCPCQKRKSF